MIRIKLIKFISLPVIILLVFVFSVKVPAVITGHCSDCHTMHNSQNGAAMVSYLYGSETSTSKEYLLRGTCLGCHAGGGSAMIASINGNNTPQVYHNDVSGDLAGGNFIYVVGGGKGGAGSDAKGHNVIDFGNLENTLTSPPGHHDPNSIGINITCAGIAGCHGVRKSGGGIKGSHHKNVDGPLNTADQVYNSYRFLDYVKGLEDSDWEKTKSASDHNEYFGATTPMTYSGSCSICHLPEGVRPSNKTISGFCGTCHRLFHVTDSIGGTSSPFTRHPTDMNLPGSGEYAAYTSYSTTAPVARPTVPALSSATVVPGGAGDTGAIVMCLSCHSAHATNYADMLRWDYKSATLSTALSGCNVCHTSRN